MSKSTPFALAQASVLHLPEAALASGAGISSQVLLDADGVRVMLLAFAAGQQRTEHSTPARALVQILSGSCEFTLAGEKRTLRSGDLLHMPPAFPHAVFATEPFSMLVTTIRKLEPLCAERKKKSPT
jgi:quercetin dioxygenase-like cupin family protein